MKRAAALSSRSTTPGVVLANERSDSIVRILQTSICLCSVYFGHGRRSWAIAALSANALGRDVVTAVERGRGALTLAMVCFRHPQAFSAGTCHRCAVGLCAPCVAATYPPTCSRCLERRTAAFDGRGMQPRLGSDASRRPRPAPRGGGEYEAIVHRALTAVLLSATGACIAWSACGLVHLFGGSRIGEPWATLVAERRWPIIALGAYITASAPYGWFFAGRWLAPWAVGMTPPARAIALRSTVLTTMAIAPFVAPFGIAHDVAWLLRRSPIHRTAKVRSSSRDRELEAGPSTELRPPADRALQPPAPDEGH